MIQEKILIIEDEPSLVKILAFDLSHSGYEVSSALNGITGLEMALAQKYAVILVDWMLPGLEGIEIIRRLRAENHHEILIMITAKDDEMSVVEGLNAGADDYIRKPYYPRELIVRIKTLLKRSSETIHVSFFTGDIEVNVDLRSVIIDGSEIELTKMEFELFHYLLEHEGRIFSRDDLLNAIWGFDYDGDSRIIDVHISRLRSKINSKSGKIQSLRGVGYGWKAVSHEE